MCTIDGTTAMHLIPLERRKAFFVNVAGAAFAESRTPSVLRETMVSTPEAAKALATTNPTGARPLFFFACVNLSVYSLDMVLVALLAGAEIEQFAEH